MTDLESLLARLHYGTDSLVDVLIEKPAPGVHVLADTVQVEPGVGVVGNHNRVSWWKGKPVAGREVTAMAAEVLEALGADLAVPGDNLITRGLDLRRLQAGDRIEIGSAVLERTSGMHRPCSLFARRISEDARRAVLATNTRGALFVVLEGGTMRTGDPITLI